MAQRTPLKWPGSKARAMTELKKYLPEGKRLVEPFAGSCSVMMNTDYDEYLIADINPDLIYLYQYIKMDAEQFIRDARRFFEVCNTAEDFYRLRADFNLCSEWQWRAAMFLYLNRHCYNGMVRYNQLGQFNIPYGRYKGPYFPEAEIRALAEKAQRATFICADFSETLGMVRDGDVIYCDPPYNPLEGKESFTGYHTGGFSTDQQQMLADSLYSLSLQGYPVVASNSDSILTNGQYGYGRFDLHKINVARSVGASAGTRVVAPEIIATRYPLDQHRLARSGTPSLP
ncbi:Dam family site-specific DNA-(adenine-N6)-methyltransferase [Erwinia persicina]|uniref:Dam family site-specific DNA-(adenine-N6)-methyltransferase n=1 Tax=Erwinia persicina TaxID=55211 RepID=UPI0016541B99|nr:Dam family site-specific DNA-(adenine-N6)-methyltransferase [Erwinia persicina]MBC3946669.1 Dam family site-specific DNA-(adenine-N6)-methyltransferase [Erwinia persicina]